MRYYNDNDPKTAEWLLALKEAGVIGTGTIDNRSIKDVVPADLAGFTRCHFFAGIAGWELALQLAGWPQDRPVWTGSCPCQPFSCDGKGKGEKDPRHLWPDFRQLIADCGPATIFGEQVASKAGREWLAGVRADLEGLGYAVGAADLCAAGEGAPHIRQRLYWVANATDSRYSRAGEGTGANGNGSHTVPQRRLAFSKPSGASAVVRLGDTTNDGLRECRRAAANVPYEPGRGSIWSEYNVATAKDGKTRRAPTEPTFFPLADGLPGRVVQLRGLGNAIVPQVAATFITSFLECECECETW